MKLLTLAGVTALILIGTADAVAADCAGELTASKPVPTLPLPPACRAMGPLRLSMSNAQVTAVMGNPDTETTPEVAYRDAVYVFPRDLTTQLRHHPVSKAEVHFGYLEVTFHDDKAVAISAVFSDPSTSFTYSVGGIAIGDSLDELLRHVKTPPVWNASKDHVGFYPYPIGVDVGADGRIFGITIANSMRPAPGRAIRFYWITDPTSGLVRGYHVTASR